MNFGSPWNDQRVDALRKLARDNLSASQIGGQLGVSRNAVIGKCSRLGISLAKSARPILTAAPSRQPGAAHNDRKITQTIRAKSKAKSDGRLHQATVKNIIKKAEEQATLPSTEAVDLPIEVIPADQRKTLYELTADTCRWPVGHPTDADFHFCGAGPRAGHPYCVAHCRMAYETPAQRKIRIAEWNAEQKRRAAA